jgi:ribosomal protein S12 methylthiotransferase accessory factor
MRMNAATLVTLSPAVGRVDQATTTTLSNRDDTIEIGGDSLPLVRAVLDALRRPIARGALAGACQDFDDDDVDAAFAFLNEHGFVVDAPADLAPWRAARRGVAVVGHGAVARAVRGALGASGLPVVDDAAGAAVVVSVSSSLLDPTALRVDRACRARGALHVPVVVDGAVAHIGPLVGPLGGPLVGPLVGPLIGPAGTADVDGGPCARCTWLRLLAVRHVNLFHLWRAHVDDDDLVPVDDVDDDLAATVAPHVLAFLRAVDADGAWGGKQHALVRVDAAGRADAHRVRRHDHCTACRPEPPRFIDVPAGALDDDAARTVATWRAHLADTSESLPPTQPMVDDFADKVTGLISLAEEWTQRGDYFRRFPVLWGGMNLARDREWVTTELQGINGTGPTVDHRRLVCVSEGAERYGQYTHRPALTHASYNDVKDHALDPRELVLYTDDRYDSPGFPRPRFDASRPQWWSWGYGLSSGKAKLLPSELVAVCVTDDAYPERLVDQRLTSGAASHTSWQRALQNGLRELVERDAHMVAWYKKIPLPHVDVGERTGDAYADDLLQFLRSVGVDLKILDVRVDFPVPTYLMVGRLKESKGSWDAGGAVFVAVADLDPIAALSRGLCETALHYETLCLTPNERKEWRNNPYDPHDPAQGWFTWWPTYMHYLNPANVAAASFLWNHDRRVALHDIQSAASSSPGADVDVYVRMLAERGLEAWAFDLVGDELRDLGFRVAKVVVPGLVDLTPGMQSVRLRAPRLDQIAARLGRPCLPAGVTNTDPHPNA